MKKILIYIFIFSSCITAVFSQQKEKKITTKDSIAPIKQKYGIRVGVDISQPIISFFQEEKNKQKGLEIIGDIRFTDRYYAAAELGYESKNTEEDFYSFSTSGSYLKLGANRNFYNNWGDMNNEFFIGARYAFSLFNHQLKNYTVNSSIPFFEKEINSKSIEFNNLSAHWLEIVIGLKAETFTNLFLGINAQFKYLAFSTKPSNFDNIYIPGFRKVSANKLGFGFTYTVSYLIPIIKKVRKHEE